MEKYKFSIIIDVLEKKEFPAKTIASILRQTIDFKKDIQLILVGSVKKNKRNLEKYFVKYSQNIKLVEASSFSTCFDRNKTLEYCEGKYINFINPNDMFSRNTLKEVYNFFEANSEDVDMVSIPFFLCKEPPSLNSRYTSFPKQNSIINLNSEPYNFMVSSANIFYKKSVISNMKFNDNLDYNSYIDLNFRMYNDNSKFGYVCSKGTKSLYKKYEELDAAKMEKVYSDVCFIMDEMVKGNLTNYQKEYILFEVSRKIKKMSKDFFENIEDYKLIVSKFKGYLNYIDNDYIINTTKVIDNLDEKYFILKFKSASFSFNMDDLGDILFNNTIAGNVSDIQLKIKKFELTNEEINLDVMYNDYNIGDLNIGIYDANDNKYSPYYNEKVKSSYDLKYGEFNYKKMRLAKFKIPLFENKLTLEFINKATSTRYLIDNTAMLSFIKITMKDEKIKIHKNGLAVSYNGKNINVEKGIKNLRNYKCSTFIHFIKEYRFLAFARLLKTKNQKYILLNDRPEKAGDNAEALFKYINTNEKSLSKNTYFVIAKKDKEYKRLKKIGNVIIQNSLKHKYMFLNAKLIASSHACKDFYIPFEIKNLKYYVDLLDYKFTWLQHGIIHNDVARSINQYNANIDYFVVSGHEEKNEVMKDSYFYEKEKIILTGMPRYDFLESENSNVISLLPTWRRSLSGKIMKSGFHEIKTGFEESDYYKEYSAILSDPKLIDMLERNNFTLQFILHPGMAGYEGYFYKFKHERIMIIPATEVDYNKVFKESNLLITDYSSVAFDFSYLKKPLIYFQFDRDMFFSNHYEPGYFDYIKDGFGEVLATSESVINKIEHYFTSAFKLEDNFLDNINKIFAFNDKDNSKRIIDQLKSSDIL